MNIKEREQISIKLNSDLVKKIKEDAEKEKRNVTKQIEYMLEKFYELKKTIN